MATLLRRTRGCDGIITFRAGAGNADPSRAGRDAAGASSGTDVLVADMANLVESVQALALRFGGPGLFLVAFLDSSFLSLPEIADLLVVWMVTHHKTRYVFYVICATLGSLAGCLVLYAIG